MDREHNPAAITVVQSTIIPFNRKAAFYQEFFLIALFYGLAGKSFPLVGRVAQLKFFDGFISKTTLFKIAEAYALPSSVSNKLS
jgi:hypothetical protein